MTNSYPLKPFDDKTESLTFIKSCFHCCSIYITDQFDLTWFLFFILNQNYKSFLTV